LVRSVTLQVNTYLPDIAGAIVCFAALLMLLRV
jgi:hypothetical protein